MCVSRASPPVSHLHFSDDSLYLCNAEPCECDEVMKALKTFGKTFGKCINFEKSSLLFGKKIPGQVKEAVKRFIDITNEGGGGMGTYHGIP